MVKELDQKTETISLTIEGGDLSMSNIIEILKNSGATIHSIDHVVAKNIAINRLFIYVFVLLILRGIQNMGLDTQLYIPLWIDISDVLDLISRLVDVIPDKGYTGNEKSPTNWGHPESLFKIKTTEGGNHLSIKVPLPRPLRDDDGNYSDYVEWYWVTEYNNDFYHTLTGECYPWRIALFRRIAEFFGGICIVNDDTDGVETHPGLLSLRKICEDEWDVYRKIMYDVVPITKDEIVSAIPKSYLQYPEELNLVDKSTIKVST